MKDNDLLEGFTEDEKQALQEIQELAEKGDIERAVRKASQTFRDGQGISVALREYIVTPAVRKGMTFQEACEKVCEAIGRIEEAEQRSRFETALQNYQQLVAEIEEAHRKSKRRKGF